MISSKDNFTAMMNKDFDDDYDVWGSDFDETYSKEIQENEMNETLEAAIIESSYENSFQEQLEIKEKKIKSGAIPKNAFSYLNKNIFLQKQITSAISREQQRNDISLLGQNKSSKGEFVTEASSPFNNESTSNSSKNIITNKIPGKLSAETFDFLKNSPGHPSFTNLKMGHTEDDNYFKIMESEISPPAFPTRPPPIFKQTGKTLNTAVTLPDKTDPNDKNEYANISGQNTLGETLQSSDFDMVEENKNVIRSNEDDKNLYINRRRFKQAKFTPVVEQLSKQLEQKKNFRVGSNDVTKKSFNADGMLLKPAVPEKHSGAFRVPLQNDSNSKSSVNQYPHETPLSVCSRISEMKKSPIMQCDVPTPGSKIERGQSLPPALPTRTPEFEILQSMPYDSEIQKLQSNPHKVSPAVPKKPRAAFRVPLQNDSNDKSSLKQYPHETPLAVCSRISEMNKSPIMQSNVPTPGSKIERGQSLPPALPTRTPEFEILQSIPYDSEIQKSQSNPYNAAIRSLEIAKLHLNLPDMHASCSEIPLLESKPPDVPKRSPDIERLQQKSRDMHRTCSEIQRSQSKPPDIPMWSSEIQRSQSQPPRVPKRNDSYLEDLKGIDFSKCNFMDSASSFSNDNEENNSLNLSQSSNSSLNSDDNNSGVRSSSLQVAAETDKGYLIPWQRADITAVQEAINRPSLPQKLNNTQRSVSYNSLIQSFTEFSVALWNSQEKVKRSSFDHGSKVTKNTKTKHQTRRSSTTSKSTENLKGSSAKEAVTIHKKNSVEVSKVPEHIERKTWFHNINGPEAQNRLLNLDEDGAFLVRPRTIPIGNNKYTLSVTQGGRMFNIHIRVKANGQYALGKEREDEKSFPSISELIKYHQDIPFEIKLAGSSQSFGVKFRVTPAR